MLSSDGDAALVAKKGRFLVARVTVSVADRKRAGFVVLRAKTGRADRGDHGQKLLERHVKIEETTLAEDPSIVVEDLIRDHQGEARKRRDRRKTPRLFDAWQPDCGGVLEISTLGTVTFISERNYFTSGTSRHE